MIIAHKLYIKAKPNEYNTFFSVFHADKHKVWHKHTILTAEEKNLLRKIIVYKYTVRISKNPNAYTRAYCKRIPFRFS